MSKRGDKSILPSLKPIRRHYGKNILEAYKIDDTDITGQKFTFEAFAYKYGITQKMYANYFNRKFDFEKRSYTIEQQWIEEREQLLLPIWLYGLEGKIHFGEFLLRMKEVSNTEMLLALEDHGERLENGKDTENSLLFQLVQRKIYDKRNRDEYKHSQALAGQSRRNNPPGISGQGKPYQGYDRRINKNPTKGRKLR